jgi:hypothetical protein
MPGIKIKGTEQKRIGWQLKNLGYAITTEKAIKFNFKNNKSPV